MVHSQASSCCEKGHFYSEPIEAKGPRYCRICGKPEPERLVSEAMKKPPEIFTATIDIKSKPPVIDNG